MDTDRREFSLRARLSKVDLNSLTESVIGAAYEVSNTLGAGFLEKLYERALRIELTLRGMSVRSQVVYPVAYKGLVIGEYTPDLVIEDRLIVELKCVDRFAPTHLAQCLSYLHASGLPLALLLNFQHPKVECRRIKRIGSQTAGRRLFPKGTESGFLELCHASSSPAE